MENMKGEPESKKLKLNDVIVQKKTSTEDIPILSVYSHKGGAGKTTITHTIGCALNKIKTFSRILMIDFDPQMNLTANIYGSEKAFETYLNALVSIENISDINDRSFQNPDINTKLNQILCYELKDNDTMCNPIDVHNIDNPPSLNAISSPCVHLIPGYHSISNVIISIMNSELQPSNYINYGKALQRLIRKYIAVWKYDLVIIDLAPDLYSLNLFALWSSNYLLIPCTPDFYSTMTFSALMNKVFPSNNDKQHNYWRFQSKLKLLGFLPNKVHISHNSNHCNPNEEHTNAIFKLREKFVQHFVSSGWFHDCNYNNINSNVNPCWLPFIHSGMNESQKNTYLGDIKFDDSKESECIRNQLTELTMWLEHAITFFSGDINIAR